MKIKKEEKDMRFKSGSAVLNGVSQAPPVAVNQMVSRMVLSAITEVTDIKSEKIVLYAPEGWGKSTWAANAESPVFISTEDGLRRVRDAADKKPKAFPEPETWQDLFDAVETLRQSQHEFKSLVLDTVDWTETLCHQFICKRDGKSSIEDYGYGKGFMIAFDEWKRLVMVLDALRRERSMNVILLAHLGIRTFNNPAGENYDRYELKSDKRISALIKEWSDCVLFGNYDVAVDVKKGQSKGKAYGGERVIYANHTAAWDAKNRYGIVDPFTTEPAAFWELVKGGSK